jgi:uncharacterized protein DUF4145
MHWFCRILGSSATPRKNVMRPELRNGQVVALCPECNAITSFETMKDGNPHSSIIINHYHRFGEKTYAKKVYKLLRCAGCSRGGIALIGDNGNTDAVVEDFYPKSIEEAKLPCEVPAGVVAEFREAEFCAGHGAYRAASALLRSTLEKVLAQNGYVRGSLNARIDEASADGVITEARKRRAHDDIRVLGNDVLHDEWRPVLPDEVEAAHLYTQRVLEDLYDDRETTLKVLEQKGRIKLPQQVAGDSTNASKI